MFDIPENKLPSSLKSEERLNVLFAPLRNRSVNPKDWEDKISTWKSIIKLYCECNDTYCFSLTTLNSVFIRHGRPPSCLPEVINNMIMKGELQTKESFLQNSPNSWSAWTLHYFIKKPVTWSLNTIKKSVFTPKINDCSYVYLEVVQLKSQALLKSIPENYRNKLINLKQLLDITKTDQSNIENIKLLLHNLASESKIFITRLNDKSDELDSYLIKFGDSNKVQPISDIDIGIYTLEKNEKLLSKHVEELEEQIDKCVSDAKTHLSKHHREMAKASLRKKHDIEKRLLKKSNALQNIHCLLEQIKDSHTDAHVWEAYKNALSTFNTTFKDTGMTEDAIEDTMIKLGEVLEMSEDIQSALGRSPLDTTIDNASLEEELAELMQTDDHSNPPPHDDSGVMDDVQKQLEKLSTLELPEVPKESPDVSTVELPIN